MPIETRTAPTGTIHAAQLQHELSAAAAVGSECTGVGVTLGDPDDTITMEFASVADDAAIEAVIAAHPSYVLGVGGSIAVTSNTWVTLYETVVGVGEWVEIDTKFIVTTGTADTLEAHTIYFECMARRRTGESVKVSDAGSTKAYGDLPNLQMRAVAISAELVRVQVRVQKTTTLAVELAKIESERGVKN
jgi:hypothetical protein